MMDFPPELLTFLRKAEREAASWIFLARNKNLANKSQKSALRLVETVPKVGQSGQIFSTKPSGRSLLNSFEIHPKGCDRGRNCKRLSARPANWSRKHDNCLL